MRRTSALIVGGGPAGTAVAITLAAAGMPHLLVERTAHTGDALCGGFLSWRSLDTLARLGIAPDTLNRTRIARLRLFAGGRVAEAPLPRPALAVSRHRLDTLLLERAVAAGSSVERGVTVRAFEDDRLRLDDGAMLSADAMFLATGKHDLRGLARPAEARGDDPALGLRVRLGPTPGLGARVGDTIELHLFDRGYAGLALQEDGSANLCMAVRRSRLAEAGDPAALIRALGREQPMLGERLESWDTASPIDAVANVPYGWRASDARAGLFRLGDQAGVIPSLAGEGMGIALESGVRAANAYLRDGADGARTYQRRLARDLRRPLAIAGTIRSAAERPGAASVLVSLAQAVPFAIDPIARLTRIGHRADRRSGAVAG